MNFNQALLWNVRTCRAGVLIEQAQKYCKQPSIRKKPQGQKPEGESTDTAHRGGVARSSDEVSVIEMERRSYIIQSIL